MSSLLLISSSTVHGSGFLDHARAELEDFLSGVSSVLFVPYALHDHRGYAENARQRFLRMGLELKSVHESGDAVAAVENAAAFFVGGGNTFRLLKQVSDRGLLEPLRRRVEEGVRYVGSSAGINLACPTIQTTNDMPIVAVSSLNALALVPFQINPHYADPDPSSTHQGETREERIRQFHEEPGNRLPVVGLREGAYLRREADSLHLKGTAGARVFRPNRDPEEFGAGADMSILLNVHPEFGLIK